MDRQQSFGKSILWRCWDAEAMAQAERSEKPLWITIYDEESPWSHAMKDAFDDVDVAVLLNDDFVPILCHAEDHSDVTRLGQTLCTLFGSPGWPVNLVLTPRLEPLFAASWLAPESGGVTPALLDVARRIKWLWAMKRSEIDSAAQVWQQRLAEALVSQQGETPQWEELASAAVLSDADENNGGYGRAPKFPQWWRLIVVSKEEEQQNQLKRSLTAMACGALQDHVNGGFHRYCRDDRWLMPLVGRHLDVQSLAALTMMKGWQLTGSPFYQRAALKCFDAMKDLTPQGELPRRGEAPWGAEQSWRRSLWNRDEVTSVLGNDALWYCDAMSITEEGTWVYPLTGDATGLSAPALGDLPSVAASQGWSLGDLLRRFDDAHEKLRHYRQAEPLVLQSSVTSSSVAFSALALARGGRLFESPALLVRSAQMMEQLQRELMDDQELLHGTNHGKPLKDATLGDWAACAAAGLELALGFRDSLWLGWAEKMALEGWQRFGSNGRLKLFCSLTAGLPECTDSSDGTSFSAPALLGITMKGLFQSLGEEVWRVRAREILFASGTSLADGPTSHAGLLFLWRSVENSEDFLFS